MQGIVEKVIDKQGSRGPYHIVKLTGPVAFMTSLKVVPQEGDTIEYEIKNANGYDWATSLTIIDSKPVEPSKTDGLLERIAVALEGILKLMEIEE